MSPSASACQTRRSSAMNRSISGDISEHSSDCTAAMPNEAVENPRKTRGSRPRTRPRVFLPPNGAEPVALSGPREATILLTLGKRTSDYGRSSLISRPIPSALREGVFYSPNVSLSGVERGRSNGRVAIQRLPLPREIPRERALLPVDVVVLPLVVDIEKPRPPLLALLLAVILDRAEAVVVVDVEHVHRVSHREVAVAGDDDHVLVVGVRGLKAQVVATEDHGAVRGEGIDHHDLVVDDGADAASGGELLNPEVAQERLLVDARGAHDGDVALL